LTSNRRRGCAQTLDVNKKNKKSFFIFFKKGVAIFGGCAMLIPVMTDEQFIRLAIVRKSQVKEWKAIPEAERPTWEQFKRGLKRKKIQK
jgi:hypothetical protein|tara:strand:+ start:1172 stop:1438 length:267 start_codon:yes stop_codon:yes gene_type:complete